MEQVAYIKVRLCLDLCCLLTVVPSGVTLQFFTVICLWVYACVIVSLLLQDNVNKLSDTGKLLLYLKLPTGSFLHSLQTAWVLLWEVEFVAGKAVCLTKTIKKKITAFAVFQKKKTNYSCSYNISATTEIVHVVSHKRCIAKSRLGAYSPKGVARKANLTNFGVGDSDRVCDFCTSFKETS